MIGNIGMSSIDYYLVANTCIARMDGILRRMTMPNKEFPINKWLRKNATPLRMIVSVAVIVALTLLLGAYYPLTAILVIVSTVISTGVLLMVWRVIWEIQHPYEPKFCKECGYVVQEYEEDDNG
jgi:hypothetical protein